MAEMEAMEVVDAEEAPEDQEDQEDQEAAATESKYHDALFADLMNECKNNAPNARFSTGLRRRLERLRPGARRALVSRTRAACAPLLVAARRGNAEAVEYLVHVCGAPLEQRGMHAEARARHSVTALWCAAVAGRADALRVLIEAGADVDAPSDTGSTPLRSACYVSHVEAVRLLLAGGADVHRTNRGGGTCLINAVQSPRLCALLLDAGAEVDARDAHGRTALHYAAQEHRLDTARLLLRRGADPRLRSLAGDDVLRVACLKGATHIVTLLLAHAQYPAWRVADAHELLGATQLDEFNDVNAALAAWRRATLLRHSTDEYTEKRYADDERAEEEGGGDGTGGAGGAGARWAEGARRALSGAREWRSMRSLDAAAGDVDRLRAQALLVAARVLGAAHRDTVFRFIYRGAAYADTFQYQRCIDLWLWALEVRVERDSVLCAESGHAALALTRLLVDAAAGRLERGPGLPRFGDAVRALELVARSAATAQRRLDARAARARARGGCGCGEAADEAGGEAARCVVHLVHVALDAARGAAARRLVAAPVRRAVRARVRSATGDTLLHLAVSRQEPVASAFFSDAAGAPAASVFPSEPVARLLLRCGADAGALNAAHCTPLHLAALPHNFSNEVVDLLLAAGAHIDQPNAFGESPLDALAGVPDVRVQPLRHVTLTCLCARVLAAHAPPPDLPRPLLELLRAHRTPTPPPPPPPARPTRARRASSGA